MPSIIQQLLAGYGSAGGGSPPPPSPPLDGLSPTGAWSASRKLLTAFGGSFYSLTSGAVDTLFDQSGSSRNLAQTTSGQRPTITTAGPNSIAALQYDGVNDGLVSAAALSAFISASAGYMIATIYIDSFPTNNTTGYSNSAILLDSGQYAGMTVRSGNIFYANNYVSGPTQAQGAVSVSTAYVVEWRHEGGILYQRVNGANETSVTSGNTGSLTGTLRMGSPTVTQPFAGKIFEAATFSTVPSLSDRNAMVQSLGLYAGASV